MLKYNFISNPDVIYPGVTLIIPIAETLERLKHVQDVDEIQKKREAEEHGADIRIVVTPDKIGEIAESTFGAFIEKGTLLPHGDAVSNSAEATSLELKHDFSLEREPGKHQQPVLQ